MLSFAIFIYEEIVHSFFSVAGFDAGDGIRFFNIPGPILDIESTTNVNRPGIWMFRIDSDDLIFPTPGNSLLDLLKN